MILINILNGTLRTAGAHDFPEIKLFRCPELQWRGLVQLQSANVNYKVQMSDSGKPWWTGHAVNEKNTQLQRSLQLYINDASQGQQ